MEDYIVILLVILSMVFGLFKKKPKELKEQEEPLSMPDFDDAFFERNNYDQPDIQYDFYNPEPEYQPWHSYNEPVAQSEIKQEPVSTFVEPVPDMGKTVSRKRKLHPFMKDFSLDKAVVYSEILNRKY